MFRLSDYPKCLSGFFNVYIMKKIETFYDLQQRVSNDVNENADNFFAALTSIHSQVGEMNFIILDGITKGKVSMSDNELHIDKDYQELFMSDLLLQVAMIQTSLAGICNTLGVELTDVINKDV